jgi:hypothetical protein
MSVARRQQAGSRPLYGGVGSLGPKAVGRERQALAGYSLSLGEWKSLEVGQKVLKVLRSLHSCFSHAVTQFG